MLFKLKFKQWEGNKLVIDIPIRNKIMDEINHKFGGTIHKLAILHIKLNDISKEYLNPANYHIQLIKPYQYRKEQNLTLYHNQ